MSKTNLPRLATNLVAARFNKESSWLKRDFVFENLNKKEEAFVHQAAQSGIDFAGSVMVAAAFQPLMTIALNCSVARAFGLPAGSGWQNLKKMSLGYGIKQTSNMFKNRVLFSLLPATLADAAAEMDVPAVGVTAIHAAIKSGLYVSIERDVATRFHAVNAKKYNFLDAGGNPPNLMKLAEKEFYQYAKNSSDQKVRKFDREDWLELQRRISQTTENFWHQAATLTMRNIITGAAAFAARPIAQMLERDFAISEQINMSKKDSEEILTQSVRLGFAWLSTPFDRAFTFLSAGKLPAEKIHQQLETELCAGNFGKKLFLTGMSRTFTCFLAAISIAEGPRFAKFMIENMPGMEDFKYEEWQKSYAEKKCEIANVKKISEASLQQWQHLILKDVEVPDKTLKHPKIDEKFKQNSCREIR